MYGPAPSTQMTTFLLYNFGIYQMSTFLLALQCFRDTNIYSFELTNFSKYHEKEVNTEMYSDRYTFTIGQIFHTYFKQNL